MSKKNAPGAPPAALPRPSSGDASFDDAALIVQERFAEEGPDVVAAFKRLGAKKPGDAERFVGLWGPQLFVFGGWGEWDEGKAKKMTPKERAACRAEHDAAYGRRSTRERYTGWLAGMLAESEVGCAAIAGSFAKMPDEARKVVLAEMRRSESPHVAAVLVAAYPVGTWKKLAPSEAPLLKLLADARVRVGRATAYEDLFPVAADDGLKPELRAAVLAGVDTASRPPGYSRFGASPAQKMGIDGRWLALGAKLLGHRNADVVDAAVNLLLASKELDVPKDWQRTLEDAKKVLGRGSKSTNGIDELLAALPKDGGEEKPKGLAKTKAKAGPLAPERRPKAPKPGVPKKVPIAKLEKQLDAMLAKAGLTKYKGSLVQPAFHLLTKRVTDDKLKVGVSKVGGLPDLPPSASWPEKRGVPMGFAAQIRLEDVRDPRLPKKGLLSFFVFDEPTDDYLKTAFVLYTPDPKKLARTSPPATFQKLRDGRPARQPYEACAVTFVPTVTIPSPTNPAVTKHLKKAELEAYEEKVGFEHDLLSQLLGYRNHGYDAENPESAQLLLRLISDDQAATEWGDVECLDFYIPKKDLAKGSFAKVYPYVGD